MNQDFILVSGCCNAEMDSWESHCPDCYEGTGLVRVFEDGSEEDVE